MRLPIKINNDLSLQGSFNNTAAGHSLHEGDMGSSSSPQDKPGDDKKNDKSCAFERDKRGKDAGFPIMMFLFGIMVGGFVHWVVTVDKLREAERVPRLFQTADSLGRWLELTPQPALEIFVRYAANLTREEHASLAKLALTHGHLSIFHWIYRQHFDKYDVVMQVSPDEALETALINGNKEACQAISTLGPSRKRLCGFVIYRAFPDAKHAQIVKWVVDRICDSP